MFFFLLYLPCYSSGQELTSLPDLSLLNSLEKQIQRGEKQALRDMGSLLNREDVRGNIYEILKKYTLFLPEEYDLPAKPDRQQFLQFYYDQEPNISFSPLLQTFYITPIEVRTVDYKIIPVEEAPPKDETRELRRLINLLENNLHTKDTTQLHEHIIGIVNLQNEEGYEYLLETLESHPFKALPKEFRIMVCEKIIEALIRFSDIRVIEAILTAQETGNLSLKKASTFLSLILNVPLLATDNLANSVQTYLDSFPAIDLLHEFGYEQTLGVKPEYFQESVDYFGKILSYSDQFPWMIQNAITEIIDTHHPRSLFYLAALPFHFRNVNKPPFSLNEIVRRMEQLTEVNIGVHDKNGIIVYSEEVLNDPISTFNYLLYWAANYEDYEWNDLRGKFINNKEVVFRKDNYERLFRLLNSENVSIAWQSYLALSEGDPLEVLALSGKYKELLRNYHPALPSFKLQYLEQLVQLTDFCRRNDTRYKAGDKMQKLLNDLQQTNTQKERYHIENQIIEQLTIENVTSLEYWACLNEKSIEDMFSIGRVLDQFYSQQWQQLIRNEDHLRLYLKKASLFKKIGSIGIVNAYLKKIDPPSPATLKMLENLQKIELDRDILELLNHLLHKKENRLEVFLTQPLIFSDREIRELQNPDPEYLEMMFRYISKNHNTATSSLFHTYLQSHPLPEMIPYCMDWLKKKVAEKQAISILNTLYAQNYDSEEWLRHWKAKGESQEQLGMYFFQKKMDWVQNQETFRIKDLNELTTSPYYSSVHENFCLEALKKVKPQRDIRRLKTTPKLNPEKGLPFFESFEFGYKELDDIPKLFEVDDPEKMLTFLELKSQDYTIEESAYLYNKLFRYKWFLEYVINGKIHTDLANKIAETLSAYLQKSTFITEFEEQATQLNIFQLINSQKTLSERLEASMQFEDDPGTLKQIHQSIFSRISYSDIPVVLEQYDLLSPEIRDVFMSENFGLPVFDLSNSMYRQELLKNQRELSEKEFYLLCLRQFGVDFTKVSGAIDYNKIYSILEFEIITPFCGKGGSKRDYFVYGIIKILEKEFSTTLGFHEKLNENQTFYSYSAAKRAAAWMNYLEKNQLLQQPVLEVHSFNRRLEE
ncbi:MAG: hypothetical protein GY705_10400 [Bacteroidetes bacterium]|nr:hypothetical protein [Bacteroidota bacterium]